MKSIYATDKKSVLFFRKMMVKQILKRCVLELKRLLSDSVCRAVSEGCNSLGKWLLLFRVKKKKILHCLILIALYSVVEQSKEWDKNSKIPRELGI